ncbi:type II toxin-antitoxin system death-on-curing family toxin [Pedobacter alpinus]|uniref:Type II toxin-antitoxin system death-on-curing family toxin n=1 Tax=Pedobacter alpinus TaxID=1590643 RepID=A0ABW5TR89_9SPHI
MIFLTKSQIIKINYLTIHQHGGNFNLPSNFLNEAALDYLVDIVHAEMFGEPLYPYIFDKAGIYLFNIIANHVFSDGNKRTGLEASLIFLKLNNYQLSDAVSNPILTDFILSVASGNESLELCKPGSSKILKKDLFNCLTNFNPFQITYKFLI